MGLRLEENKPGQGDFAGTSLSTENRADACIEGGTGASFPYSS